MIIPLLALAFAQDCPPRDVWPGDEWAVAADDPSRADAKKALEAFAFTLTGADEDRKGPRTDAVLIARGGTIVYEKYARGFDASKKHLSWSVSKSVTNALLGIAIQNGLLSIDDSICKYIDKLPPESCAVTLLNLSQMGSGFDWKEVYENESNQQSSVLALLYGQGHDDTGRFNAMHPLRDKPGTSWLYSSGDTCTLADAVGKALTPKFGDRFVWPVLFDKLGMKHSAFERDHAGTFIGASYFYATARDAARFGYLYQNDGCWKGERLLPEGFVKRSATVNDAFLAKHVRADEKNPYGLGWWVNVPVPAHHLDKPYPDAPDDMFAAEGHWGQSITVIPSLDLVIVRFGDDREHGAFNGNTFLKLAIAVGKAP